MLNKKQISEAVTKFNIVAKRNLGKNLSGPEANAIAHAAAGWVVDGFKAGVLTEAEARRKLRTMEAYVPVTAGIWLRRLEREI